ASSSAAASTDTPPEPAGSVRGELKSRPSTFGQSTSFGEKSAMYPSMTQSPCCRKSKSDHLGSAAFLSGCARSPRARVEGTRLLDRDLLRQNHDGAGRARLRVLLWTHEKFERLVRRARRQAPTALLLVEVEIAELHGCTVPVPHPNGVVLRASAR